MTPSPDTLRQRADMESLANLSLSIGQQARILTTALSFMSDFAYIFDRNGCFVYANQALLTLWGLPLDEVTGKNFFELPYPNDVAATLQRQIQQVFDTRHGLTDQTLYTSPTGEEGFFEYIFQPVLNADGTVDLVVGSTRDITMHKHAAIVEQEARRFWQSTLDALPSHIAVLDEDGTIIAVNRAWQQFAEDNEGEPISCGIGANYLVVCSSATGENAEEAPMVTEGIRAVMTGERPDFRLEYPCHSPTEQRWFSLRVTPFGGEGPVRVVVAHENITARKLAEESLQAAHNHLEQRVQERTRDLSQANMELAAEISERQRAETSLRDSEQRFRSLLDLAPEGIGLFDQQGCCLQANQRAADLLGYSLHELQGMSLQAFVVPEDWPGMVTQIPALPVGASNTRERVLMRKDGSTFLAEISSAILPDFMMQSIFRDITARTAVAEQLRQAKTEAEQANLAKSEFLSRMSHELRTPLNAILGFSQILEKERLSPLQHESVGYVLKGGRHLLNLVNEVLDIARVEAGRFEISPEPVALDDVIPEACALMRPLAQNRSLRLDWELATYGRNYILADRQRLKQVLINLLSNAIKYNRPGGQVTVSCTVTSTNKIRIAVRDTGPGIAAEDLPRLFTPFERLSAVNSDVEGTGLGLALSQRLVAVQGGTLEVESIVGQGSVFTIELPCVGGPEATLASVPADAGEVGRSEVVRGQYTVLCIEDNVSNLRLLEIILAHRPEVRLLTAMQGSTGLDFARQHEPDLILLDLHLPDMSGHEVLRRLKRSGLTRDIPVVIISADATSPQARQVLDAGAMAYLTKPLDVARFLSVLDEVLRTSEATRTKVRPDESTP